VSTDSGVHRRGFGEERFMCVSNILIICLKMHQNAFTSGLIYGNIIHSFNAFFCCLNLLLLFAAISVSDE